MTLVEKNIPFELRNVDLNNKSEEFQQVYKSISPDPDAPAKVPILLDGPTHLIESLVVVEYLATKYRDVGIDLMPTDFGDQAKARLFIETFTNHIINPFFALFFMDTHEAVAAGREKLANGFTLVDACLRIHGNEEGGNYFLGKNFTIADVCTVPFLQRVLVCLPAFRDIDSWAMIRDVKSDRLMKWCEAVLERPAAKETKPTDEDIINSLKKFVKEIKPTEQ